MPLASRHLKMSDECECRHRGKLVIIRARTYLLRQRYTGITKFLSLIISGTSILISASRLPFLYKAI